MYPFFKFTDQFIVYLYPLMMGISWGVGYLLANQINESFKNPFKFLKSYFFIVFIISWIGAKVFFLLTTNQLNTSNTNFWFGGGFVFYGGLIFGIVFTLFFIKYYSINIKHLVIFIPSLAIGHAIGRIGCFLAGCCYGKESTVITSVFLHGDYRHPVQLYESFLLLITGVTFWILLTRKQFIYKNLWISYLFIYALIRFILEFFRGDTIRGIWFLELSSSQIVSIMMVFFLSIYLIISKTKDNY